MSRTHRWIALLAVALIGLGLMAPGGAAEPALAESCPAELPLGQVFDCAIGAAGEVDAYTFAGSTNDKLVVRASRTSGTYYLSVRVRDQNGNQVCVDVGTTKAAVACTLASTGTFTLQVYDYYNNSTGGYSAYVQRLNGPAAATPVSLGAMYGGALGYGIETDTYSFTAEINDQIELRLLRLTGDFTASMGVYDKNGTRVCYDVGNQLALIAPCVISETGTYHVLIDDYYTASPGTYQWTLQRWGRPGEGQAIELGQVYEGGLSSSIESDVYTFDASQNDQLIFRTQRGAGALSLRMRLYDSAGNRVCYGDGSALARIEPCVIEAAGSYSLMVDDYYVASPGTYTLHTQRINSPGAAQQLALGQTLDGSLDKVAALDTYTFDAAQNDVITLSFKRTSGDFAPRARIFDAGSDQVCYADGNTEATLRSCTLKATGRYTLIVDDYYVRSTGNYTLALGCVSGPCSTIGKQLVYLPLVRKPR